MSSVWPVPEDEVGELSPVECWCLSLMQLENWCAWLSSAPGGIHLEHQWKVHLLTILVDSMLVGGTNFQPCLFACYHLHPSWQLLQLLHGFPHPGHHKGPEEHGLVLAMLE